MRQLFALCILGAATAWSVSAQAVLIKIHSPVTVTGRVVRLGDVAEIHDADEQLVARLEAVTLAPAPADGRKLQLDFETIRSRLIAHGTSLGHLEFSGSSTVQVTSAAKPATDVEEDVSPTSDLTKKRLEELLSQAASRYIAVKNPQLGEVQVFVRWNDEQNPLFAAPGNARYEVSGGTEPWSGEQTFQVRFYDRQGKKRELPIRCEVRPIPRVVVARQSVSRGQVLQAEDLVWRQMADRPNRSPALDRMEDAVGKEAKRALRALEPISAEDVRGIPLIRRGEIVTVLSRRPGITVRMEAKAQNDGAMGEQITVTLLDGRQKLEARVTGYHEAAVDPQGGSKQTPQRDAPGIRFVQGKP